MPVAREFRVNGAKDAVDAATDELIDARVEAPGRDDGVPDQRLAPVLHGLFVEVLDEVRPQRVAGRRDEEAEDP